MRRSSSSILPSPRAIALYEDIRPILSQIERAVQPPVNFVPSTSNRVFNMAGPALDCVASGVVARMQKEAPATVLAWQPYTKETIGKLMNGEIDIAFGNANFPLPEGLSNETLRPMKRYVMARRDHPATNDWSLESWMQYPHVVVQIPAAIHGTVEEHLAGLGLKRRIGLHASSWSGIASALRGTNMFANTPGLAILESDDGRNIQVFEPPEPMPDLVFRVMWKTEINAEPALSWLRHIVLQTFDELSADVDKWISVADIVQPRDVEH